ncbi:hypothetical protein QTH89_11800 [Variovorax sp. J22G21]|uniref:hypothetical protein n=1 Tax=Variovorax fucosicus TaxID=3053517 RepID=UPI0025787A14|nr:MULTISPECIES: hypothetical protein [unclassified Variovorax]MDM0040514.1 hypothetical protein [Variovorax sp. J22R193]MDM0061887.1 hypothetical protein [Variovorax sp. J22G21]
MALICPACGTENRAVSKFCIECIGVLQPDFEPTKVVPLRPSGGRNTTLLGMPSALAAFASSAPASAPAPTPVPAPVKSRDVPETRKGLWLSLAAFALTLVIGAAGWVVAGAGGWYIYSSSSAAEDAAHPVAPAAAAPVAAAPLLIAPATVAPAARVVPAKDVAVAVIARPAAPPSKPRGMAHSDPGTSCASLGFLARSQCMVAQCAKGEYRAQPACQAVVAQQRLMEEKRNPTLAN